MKVFILAYTLCSAITGMCNNTMTLPHHFESWTECAKAGAVVTIKLNNIHAEKFNKEKLYIKYFCNENHINETTTESEPKPSKVQSSYIRS